MVKTHDVRFHSAPSFRSTTLFTHSFGKAGWCSLFVLAFLLSLLWAASAFAHFQVILPDRNIVAQGESRTITLDLRFTHPFEGQLMNMASPLRFGVVARGETTDLLGTLAKVEHAGGLLSWKGTFDVTRPGDHIFFVEPEPYWEPAEGKYIVHLTKTVVNAFGMEEGWDEPAGLRAEILPLTRPYGLWAGNSFTGQVLVEGKPLAGAEVEVEFLNDNGAVKAPADPFVTQVVKTDDRGIFSYTMPWGGWWGFAALAEAPETKKAPDGTDAPIELGAVLWVRTENRP